MVSLGIAGVYGYCTIFSKFPPYDDEGFLMLCLRNFLDGLPLYDGVPAPYGPFYFFYQWSLHGLASVPVTHDAAGLLCLFHWVTAALVLALAAGVMTRSVTVALFVFMQATVHLRYLANEPGAPQELAAVLLACATLVATKGSMRPWTLVLLGAIGAALSLTKINVGVFFGLGLLLALACRARFFDSRRAWFWALLASSSLLPFWLMRLHLVEGWARAYAGQACIAVLTGGAAAYVFQKKQDVGLKQVAQVACGFGGLSALLLTFPLLMSSSLPGLVHGLIIGPAKLPGLFAVPTKIPNSVGSGAAALLLAAIAMRARPPSLRLVLGAAKGIYGAVGALALALDPRYQLAYLLPWGWLLLVPAQTAPDSENRDSFPRTFLCLLAAWQSLQAYPVAGSQVALATFLPVLLYTLCLHDAIIGLASATWMTSRVPRLMPRTASLLQALTLAALLYLFAVPASAVHSIWRYHLQMKPLALRGARCLRLPPSQTEPYQEVARYLETECDTFLTYPGMNSLYFWTGKRPPTDLMLNGEAVPLSPDLQARIVAALHGKRALVVINEIQANRLTQGGTTDQGPLLRFIREECHEVARSGPFRILAPPALSR